MNYSFGIANAKEFLSILEREYEDYRKNPTDSGKAINCASKAWHIREWLRPKKPIEDGDFDSIRNTLKIMQDITNGSKHMEIDRYTPIVQTAYVSVTASAFQTNAFQHSAFQVGQSKLVVRLNDGKKVYFEDEIEKAVTFWKSYI